MTMINVWVQIDEGRVTQMLVEAKERLDSLGDDVLLDFSSLRRLDPSGLCALEDLASAADGKAVNVRLRGVNVDVYKVLKLARLSSRFSIVN